MCKQWVCAAVYLAAAALIASAASNEDASLPDIVLDGSPGSLQRLLEHHLGLAKRNHPHSSFTPQPQEQEEHQHRSDKKRRQLRQPSSNKTANKRPNFLVIMTDDQDQLLNSTDAYYMPALHRQIATRGLQLRSFTVSTSVCCPSRVNFLTGRFAHNNNVTGNISPRGGFAKFWQTKQDHSYLPTWMQSLGYRTYFTGKFLNGFDPSPTAKQNKCPKGWSVFEPLIKPYVLDYWRTGFTTNCEAYHTYEGQYNTDVLTNKTLSYIGDAANHPDQPFFIFAAPIAPHEGCGGTAGNRDSDSCANPPEPAPRHADLFPEVQLPRTSNYGVAPPDGTLNWVDSAVRNRGWNADRMRSMYLDRLRALRAVDEMIDASVLLLEQLNLLENTYVIFMSDNGFKIGNHGVAKGKMTAYEEDVRVPFFIRGPGIPEAVISDYGATVCDVPATLVDLAGATSPWPVDGTPIPLKTLVGFQPMQFNSSGDWRTTLQGQGQLALPRDQVPHEMWVRGSDTRLNGRDYRAVRLCTSYLAFGSPEEYRAAAMSPDATFGFRVNGTVPYDAPKQDVLDGDTPITCYKYVVWCTGTVELYDLMLDPREVLNRITVAPKRFVDRLDAYMTVQGFCRGKDCYSPYMVLHSAGRVRTFEDTMAPGLDKLYASLPKFAFKQCTLYYYPENEQGWLSYNTTVDVDSWPKGGAVLGAEPGSEHSPPVVAVLLPPAPATHLNSSSGGSATSSSNAEGGEGELSVFAESDEEQSIGEVSLEASDGEQSLESEEPEVEESAGNVTALGTPSDAPAPPAADGVAPSNVLEALLARAQAQAQALADLQQQVLAAGVP